MGDGKCGRRRGQLFLRDVAHDESAAEICSGFRCRSRKTQNHQVPRGKKEEQLMTIFKSWGGSWPRRAPLQIEASAESRIPARPPGHGRSGERPARE